MSESASTWERWFLAPVLTRKRIWFAFVVAAATDALQILLGPLGWVMTDQVLDIIAMVLISRAIGFHPLLLPTFAVEFIPVADMLPSWVGCTMLVVVLRRKAQAPPPPISPVPPVVTTQPEARPTQKLLQGPEP